MGGSVMTMLQFTKIDCAELDGEPLHYTAFGVDNIYLMNGFRRETIDGETFTSIEDLDGLWKAIGLHLVTTRKVLAPKEIRYLREHMGLTQAELGARLRVSDQTVARWEKGETKLLHGPGDVMLRVLFLASKCAQPEGNKILKELIKLLDEIVEKDEKPIPCGVVFSHEKNKWKKSERCLELV
jgi:DNA-binding transcriptional regulator YiaG